MKSGVISVLTKWKEVFQGNNAIVMLQWNQIGVIKSNNIIITPPLKQKRGWWERQYFGHTSVLTLKLLDRVHADTLQFWKTL